MRKKILEVKNLNFVRGGKSILEDINFSLEKGEYLGIVGPNGSGKTTLVKIILGLLEPTAGEVKIFGEKNTKSETLEKIGFVSQNVEHRESFFPATAREIVSSGLIKNTGFWKKESKEQKKNVEKAMETADISDLKDRIVGILSGGQQQRVFIARALVLKPEILILDEPTVGVDMKSKETFYKFLREINKKLGITIILISHDVDVVSKEVEHLLCLNKNMVCFGKRKDILADSRMEKMYGKNVSFIPHSH